MFLRLYSEFWSLFECLSPCLYLFGVGLEKDLADTTTASDVL
jgi:hypothetical protein